MVGEVQFGSKGRGGGGFGGDNAGFGGDGAGFGQGENGEERPPPFKPEEINLEEEAQLRCEKGINFDRYDKIQVDIRGADIKPIESFSEKITSDLLLQNIAKSGYVKMTPVQKYTIPAMIGGYDIVACAQTGSGKTAAFLLPIIQTILKEPDLDSQYGQECQEPRCVIIAPTRELAKQTYVEALKLSADSMCKCQYIYGGIATGHLKAQMSRGCHLLVTTPGRLKDFIERNWIGLSKVKYIVLDEGDRLIDDGFVSDMRALFTNQSMPGKSERQTLFFSATFKDEARAIAEEFMKDDYLFLTIGLVGAANEDIKQEFLRVTRPEKKRELKKILNSLSQDDKAIVFAQTKATADILSGYLSGSGIECTSIHGDRHQFQREQAISEFKRGTKKCLVASPVGERGLDLPKVTMVINYDLPNELDEYIHRIGRTGRIGNTGRAISFFDPERDMRLVNELTRVLRQAQQPIPDFFSNTSFNPDGDQGSNENQEFGGATNSVPAVADAGEDEEW